MQAVILAAGKSTRTHPLTITKPKPLLKIANKTLLEHNLDNLLNVVDEVIIVVGYKKNLIKKYLGIRYKNLKIRYVEQKEQLGTGHAVLTAEHFINGKFLLMMGDDIYSRNDINNSIKYRYSILVHKTRKWKNFGVVLEKNGILIDFVEKPKKFVSDLVNTAYYVLDKEIFGYLHSINKSSRNEFEFPDALNLLAKNESVHCVQATHWLPIVYPWDLLVADRNLRGRSNLIGKNSRIHGNVINSTIGDNCLIKGIVKNSLVMDNAFIDGGSVVEDSVFGENIHFKGKISAKNNVFSLVNHKKIKVDRFGAVIGDNSMLKDVVVNAGCKIYPSTRIKNKKIMHDV